MPNLFHGKINTNNEYVTLSELTGVTFEAGTKYLVQILGVANVCLLATKPEEEGFLISDKQVWGYKPKALPDDTLWIRTPETPAIINVSS